MERKFEWQQNVGCPLSVIPEEVLELVNSNDALGFFKH